MSRFLIAGTNSGSGKTTLTLGILRAFGARGLTVAPFKCGPDYIDPLFHRQAAKRASVNLDGFLAGAEGVRSSFARHAAGADAAVVEGVMGLFDGNAPAALEGSSAEIAALLELPVILVVNARGMAGSIAPLVRGFAGWHPAVRIAGVIANNVGSARHTELLRGSLAAAGLPPLLGGVPRDERLILPERHLGLATGTLEASWLDLLGDTVGGAVDLDRLLELTREPLPESGPCRREPLPEPELRLGVACDEAFNFHYRENFDLLRQLGVEPVGFSPLRQPELPGDLDGLWFGGGFPELYAQELAANAAMLDSIRSFAASGRPVYGECGGYLYLLEALTGFDGVRHPLLGLLPGEAVMRDRLASLGYREVETVSDTVFGPAGTRLRGHEFHYSALAAEPGGKPLFAAKDLRGNVRPAGSARGNVCGSYIHLYFGSNPAAAAAFAEGMRR